MSEVEAFSDAGSLAEGAAEVIARTLGAGDARSFVATGGTTPGATYDHLARRDLAWEGITVTLSDERFVPPSSADSNEGLVRRRLLTGRATVAGLLPLRSGGASPEADAAAAEPLIAALLPFAAVLLGMGVDGHIASLFPGAAGLEGWLDPAGARLCVGVAAPALEPRVPRISLTLAALLRARLIVVLATGSAKRAILEAAGDPASGLPIAALLRQSVTPVRVLWSP